jgi:hypothetical protein
MAQTKEPLKEEYGQPKSGSEFPDGFLGCNFTKRETRVEMSDWASVALCRRDGRHSPTG